MKFGIAGKAAVVAATLTVMAGSSAAWAVCNDPPASRYVVKGDQVYDKMTDLTWQRCSVGEKWQDGAGCVGDAKRMTWEDAKKTPSGDWRMPTKEELLSLVSPTCKRPAINDVFPDKESNTHWYWSSTEYGVQYAAYVGFTGGGTYNGERVNTYAVRLVKKGQ